MKVWPPKAEKAIKKFELIDIEALIKAADCEVTSYGQLEFISEISSVPREVCAYHIDGEVIWTLLDEEVSSLIRSGEVKAPFFPVVWPQKPFQVITHEAEDMTSFFFTIRERVSLEEADFEYSRELPIVLVRGLIRVGSDLSLYKETIVSDEEEVLFQIWSSERQVFLTQDGVEIRSPILPTLKFRLQPDSYCEIWYDIERSRKVRGWLKSAKRDLFSDAFFSGQVEISLFDAELVEDEKVISSHDEIELPSFLLVFSRFSAQDLEKEAMKVSSSFFSERLSKSK